MLTKGQHCEVQIPSSIDPTKVACEVKAAGMLGKQFPAPPLTTYMESSFCMTVIFFPGFSAGIEPMIQFGET